MIMNSELRARREALVLRHIDAENRHDVDATVATMTRPHYDMVAWGMEIDGADDVREFLRGYFIMMPGITTEAERIHHADDAVIVEVWTHGSHDGDFEGIPANGNPIDIRSLGIFYFDGDALIGEKVVADTDTLVRQMRGDVAPG
jgi:steroid delta-isomerase-like uncharacterized protein